MEIETVAGQQQARTNGGPGLYRGTESRFLALLPERELGRLIAMCQRIELAPRQILHHRNLPVEYVYFVENGLVSVMAKVGDNDWVEAWLVGSEGTTSVPVLLGDSQTPLRRVVQIGGTALRIPTSAFHHVLDQSEPVRQLLFKYTQLVLLQSSQFGACNAQHSVRERLARWLLVARDGLESALIAMPHQALARLIGVRRATISECLNGFEARGAIRTSRRLVEIADSAKLEALSCDCYRIFKRERRRLLGL
ncbi:MAG: Crp/Fnr family transcriptional regulator [Rhizomicrobium sp.]